MIPRGSSRFSLYAARGISLRTSEWVLLSFFGYLVAITPFFQNRPHLRLWPVAVFVGMFAALSLAAALENANARMSVHAMRDWVPILYTFIAFREMELFLTTAYNRHREARWIKLDGLVLGGWHLRSAIESFGSCIPLYLELCYLLVYAVGPVCVAVLYVAGKRRLCDNFWTIYWSGTLLAYALFPYFPSQPPRLLFPNVQAPHFHTWVREFNLLILKKASIHSSVFPSAHVSSAFAAAFAMFALLPERKRVGWLLLGYSASLAIAAVYGRYHYVADVVGGFIVSLLAAAVAVLLKKSKS